MKLRQLFSLVTCIVMMFCCTACNNDSAGKDGLSAYELAVQNGFVGTLDEWLDSLKGTDGKDAEAPYVGKNGNWWVGNTDLGVSATGYPAGVTSVVTLGIVPGTGEDLADKIQAVIDANPNTTLFFPDGEYLVSKPIKTSAKYDESVSLWLANYAEIKATSTWSGGSTDAIIMLGARNPYNTIYKPGSNYLLEGGIINGNGKANGVSVDSGRETRIENVSIKNTVIGLHIKYGANSGSSDADVSNVNIVCNSRKNTIGVLVEGYDNTFQNMRISGAQIGVYAKSGGNFFRDIHPLIGDMSLYSGSIGFYVEGGSWFDVCYADNFETGFKVGSSSSTFTNCYVFWYYKNGTTPKITKEIGFHFPDKFNSTIKDTIVSFKNEDNVDNAYIRVGVSGGSGVIYNPRVSSKNDDNTYLNYLVTPK